MSILSSIIGGGAAAPITAIGNVLDELFTSDEEKLNKQEVLAKLALKPQLAQIELNKVEAQHRSIFVAGWRPFIGWVCGFALAWHFMLYDISIWVAANWFPDTMIPELGGTEHLITIVMSLLGLGAFRTVEKLQGKSK